MFKKKTSSPDIDRAVAQGVSFELTLAERARKSERRAWLVAWSAIVMSLILAGGYFIFLPLKEKVPYLVMADPYTGTASVARLSGTSRTATLPRRKRSTRATWRSSCWRGNPTIPD